MKVYKVGKYHHKNDYFLEKYIDYKKFIRVNSVEEADLIFSPSKYFEIEKFPNKKFIFGPHFSVFPNEIVNSFKNIHKNAVYIQPSKQPLNIWKNDFNFSALPLYSITFGVDSNLFKPSNEEKNSILIYFKNRDPKDLGFLLKYFKDYDIKLFKYGSYNEENYIKELQSCKFGVWLGSSESQGFALQEALSMNIPLLVWNVKNRRDNYSNRNDKVNIKSEVSSINYWDKKCGEYFYQKVELEETFNKFINNLDNYKPREFIMENLSMEKCYEKWDKLVGSL